MSNKKLSGLSVLIIEDVRAMRAIIRATLRNLGIDDVLEASDGQAALELLHRRGVEIVITDICMEPMDGIEFTRQLRRPGNGLNPYVPVLMVSAHTEVSLVKDALEAGVTAFLAKPVTTMAMQKKLTAILQLPLRPIRTETYCGPDRRRSSVRTRKCRRASDLAATDPRPTV